MKCCPQATEQSNLRVAGYQLEESGAMIPRRFVRPRFDRWIQPMLNRIQCIHCTRSAPSWLSRDLELHYSLGPLLDSLNVARRPFSNSGNVQLRGIVREGIAEGYFTTTEIGFQNAPVS